MLNVGLTSVLNYPQFCIEFELFYLQFLLILKGGGQKGAGLEDLGN